MKEMAKQPKRKKVCIIATAAVLTVALALGVWALFFRAPQRQWVMKVNGEPVWEEEFDFLLQSNHTTLLSQVKEQYGEETANGEDQEALLREACRSLAVSQKVRLQLAVSLGVLESSDFYDLQNEMQQKNQENQQAVEEGKPVYGLLTYDFQQYYSYAYSNALLRSKEVLGQGELKPSEEEIAGYYEDNKETLFAKVDDFSYILISAEASEESAALLSQMQGMTQQEMEAFCQEHPELTLEKAEVDNEGFRTLSRTSETVANALLSLQSGQASGLLDNAGKYQLLYCVSRTDAGADPLDDVRPNIISALIDQKYEEKLADLEEQAQIEINQGYFLK